VEYTEIPGPGHLVQEERPETVAAVLLPWLDRHLGGEARNRLASR
jgi:pimeloyl-ACP methyl ester carboxylesterase